MSTELDKRSFYHALESPANRRRFRREGVALMTGDPSRRVPLPIASRREIYVRPAWRGTPRRRGALSEAVFDTLGRLVTVTAAVLVIAVIIAQIVISHHAH